MYVYNQLFLKVSAIFWSRSRFHFLNLVGGVTVVALLLGLAAVLLLLSVLRLLVRREEEVVVLVLTATGGAVELSTPRAAALHIHLFAHPHTSHRPSLLLLHPQIENKASHIVVSSINL